jgi:hypothetical protein
MKRILLLAMLSACSTLRAQTVNPATTNLDALPSPKPYVVVSRGANSAVWQRQTYERAPDGGVVTNIQKYTELASGLNHSVNGQWVPSTENIEITADGTSASATNGQHQAYFPGDIYDGEIKLVTPDGKTIQSQPVGLAYSDGSNSVLLAVVTNSIGAILPSGNQVIYTNAFAGLNADLLYTYTKAGFEQDVVLREQPPDPAPLGLNPAKTRLQVITEFFNPPQPGIWAATVATAAGNLEDDSLSFGVMRMGHGKAFLLGAKSPSVRVEKRWLMLNGRQFLIEEVPIVSVAKAIDTLPRFAGLTGANTKFAVAGNLILPAPRQVRKSASTMFLAQAAAPSRGLVLDYQTISGDTNDFTFRGDLTYYITGEFDVESNLTIEGGTVIKFDESGSYPNGGILPLGEFKCDTSAYHPAIITSANDNALGAAISGSSGNPSNYDCSALDFDVSPTLNGPVEYVYIHYAAIGLEYGDVSCTPVRNCQFLNVGDGIQDFDCSTPLDVENALFSKVSGHALNSSFGSFVAANLTVHHANDLVAGKKNSLLCQGSGLQCHGRSSKPN